MGAQQSAADLSSFDDFEIINVYKDIDTVKHQKPLAFELQRPIKEAIIPDMVIKEMPDFKQENRRKREQKIKNVQKHFKKTDYILKYVDSVLPQTINQEIEMHFNHIINTRSFNDLETYIRDMVIKYHSISYKRNI